MSMCATQQTKGFYFGYFWVWYMSAQIIGNFAGAILILNNPGPTFFGIMGVFEVVVCFGFCCISIPKKVRVQSTEDLSESLTQVPNDLELDQSHFCSDLFGTVRLLFSKDMLFLNLNLIWNGATIAFWSSILTPIMILQNPELDEDEQLSKALYGMVAFGFGEVIGGFAHGILIDKIGSKKAVIVNLGILVAAIAATIISLKSLEYNFYTFLMCFMWGYEDGS